MTPTQLIAQRRARQALIASAVLTAILYVVPMGRFVAYPLMLLSTLVHELGHGMVSLALGHELHDLAIYADGSGIAKHAGASDPLHRGLISAGGLVGPALASGLAFALGRRERLARVALAAVAVFFVVVTALFIRNPFGIAFTAALGLGLGWVALRRGDWSQLTLVFLAVQLGLSVFSRGDYLFVKQAHTAAGVMPSDVQHIALAWGGPYWLWGLVCGGFSVLIVALGIAWYTRFEWRRRPASVKARA